jgi:hypothetical protein
METNVAGALEIAKHMHLATKAVEVMSPALLVIWTI